MYFVKMGRVDRLTEIKRCERNMEVILFMTYCSEELDMVCHSKVCLKIFPRIVD